MKQFFSLLLAGFLASCQSDGQKTDEYTADVIVYGGTSGAVTAAVQVVKQGKTVLVVSPDKHLGGLSSGGLGFTDTGNKSVIGGLAREFYHRVYMHYDTPEAWQWQKKEEYGNKGQGTPAMDGADRTMWIFEPKVAEKVFEDFVKENNVKIYRDEWLDREGGVTKKDGKIVSIKTLSGKTFTGKMFIDATYEGDLMAAADVKFHVGREANSVYDEKWNGIQAGVFQHGHYFKKNVSPYKIEGDPKSGLLPYVSAEKIGKNGEGDNKIQAYCFRMCLSMNPDNRIPFEKPAGYDPAKYELLARVYKAGWTETFDKYDPIPNKKTDTNNHGPFSTDFIGQNYDYPEATYERRKQIIKEHELYQKGLMYYLTNDKNVPEDVRKEMSKWGLPKDEFKDNGGWPHQLYIREARRMIGKEVMTENETLGKKAVNESVGMGSYSLDAHNAHRYVKEDGFVQNEGDIGVHPKTPYAISYGSLVPKKEECENLLVPVCLSSSHIAFGSIRMEPVFMILGQSAASAAILAIDKNIAVQDVDYAQLREQLLKDKQRLEYVAPVK
ncbi:FAD-dependent oxidoreductase [Dyadobacter sp. UC 10]|nr:FAD-dependent oxidoreductase [Dyadobacter sp. UC 10]KAA0992828.1 FAD-dependent oxidoreductase [Dyadobacter sp. UC 10]